MFEPTRTTPLRLLSAVSETSKVQLPLGRTDCQESAKTERSEHHASAFLITRTPGSEDHHPDPDRCRRDHRVVSHRGPPEDLRLQLHHARQLTLVFSLEAGERPATEIGTE